MMGTQRNKVDREQTRWAHSKPPRSAEPPWKSVVPGSTKRKPRQGSWSRKAQSKKNGAMKTRRRSAPHGAVLRLTAPFCASRRAVPSYGRWTNLSKNLSQRPSGTTGGPPEHKQKHPSLWKLWVKEVALSPFSPFSLAPVCP